MTAVSPIVIEPPAIPGLAFWAYFGSGPSDNINLVPGSRAISNIGSGPVSIQSNFITCWYNATLSSGWRRNNDSANGPFTLVGLGNQHNGAAGTCAMAGDPVFSLSIRQQEPSLGGTTPPPGIAANRSALATNGLQIPSALTPCFAAMTEPGAGVSGSSVVMDFTRNTIATGPTANGVAASTAGQELVIGTSTGYGAGSIQADMYFMAIVSGVQLTQAQILAQIVTPARSMLARRGVSGY